jgi:ketosteroid isomerase-like protein
MNRCVAVMTGVLVVACATGQSASTTAMSSAADSAAIAALEARLQSDGIAGNWDAFSAEYTADPVRFPPDVAPLVGKAAADAFNHGTPRFSTITFTLTSVVIRSDLAVATVNYTAVLPAGKEAAGQATPGMNLQGNWMQILHKQPDGSWKISSDIWNSSLPASSATAAASH